LTTHVSAEITCLRGNEVWISINHGRASRWYIAPWRDSTNPLYRLYGALYVAIMAYQWDEFTLEYGEQRLRHGLKLSKQWKPLRKLRALLRRLGGEFV
jgi:hypothetical protein